MVAHRLKILIPEDHRLVVDIPEDVPAGPAELILMVAKPPEGESEDVAMIKGAKERFEKLADELAADPRPFRDLSPEERRSRLRRVAGIGRGLFSSSEEFARRKQEEIALEERHLGRR
jgi:hypothetical protein